MAKIINRLRKSKDARTLISNFIYLSLLKGVTVLFPIITLPYLAKIIGPGKFGTIAFASSIMVIVETITDWGFNYTATRDVAVNRDDKKYVSDIYSQVLFSRITLTVICFTILYTCIQVIPFLKQYEAVLLITFLYIPGNIIYPQWLFQALEKMRYITILTLIARIIFTVLVFVLIKKESDYILEPLLTAGGYIVSGIIAQIIIARQFGIRIRFQKFRSIYSRLKESTDMFICLLLPNLYNNLTTIVLNSFCGQTATGIYNAGQKLQNIVDNFTAILSRVFFPFLARHREKHHIYVMISGGIALIASIGMFFGAQLFIDVFLTPEFNKAIIVMRIFSVTPILMFLMNTYGTNYLVIIGKERISRNITLVSSLIGFILTWIITPLYSFIGAAITVTVSRSINGVSTYIYANKEKRQLQVSITSN